jgi:hypothetical protein
MFDIEIYLGLGNAVKEWLRQRERKKLREKKLLVARARLFANRYKLELNAFLDDYEKALVQ